MDEQAWENLSDDQKKRLATDLFNSPRGKFILGKCLSVARQVMLSTKYPEKSDAFDMHVMGFLFEPFYTLSEVTPYRFETPPVQINPPSEG